VNRTTEPPSQAATLPQLEHLLVRAARHRTGARFARRRWALSVAAASLLAAGAAVAATDVFELASGETEGGIFRVERATRVTGRDAPAGSVCLQLTFSGRGAAYGCGARPTGSRPFGLVIADPLDNGAERVVYGLVVDAISRIRVLGGKGSETAAATGEQAGLPGRFFAIVVPSDGRIELVGYDDGGGEIARIGSIGGEETRPLSKAEAIEQGDPAGFAPAVPAPETYLYEDEPIDPGGVSQRGLACLEGRVVVRCYDSATEAERARGRP